MVALPGALGGLHVAQQGATAGQHDTAFGDIGAECRTVGEIRAGCLEVAGALQSLSYSLRTK